MNPHQKARHRAHRHLVKRRRKERQGFLELQRRAARAEEEALGLRRMSYVDETADFTPAPVHKMLCDEARRDNGEGC